MKKIILALLIIANTTNANDFSYIWDMHFPALVEPAQECCFDLDNDSTIDDDGLGGILLNLESQSTTAFQAAINQGLLSND